MSIVLLGINYLGLFLLKQPIIFSKKTTVLFSAFQGGQFQEAGGQFKMAHGGHFT
jgi:hypothetical protein